MPWLPKSSIAIHDNPFNKSLVKDNAICFSKAKDICEIVNTGKYADETHIRNNYTTIKNHFSWDQIISQYEQYFMACYRSNNVFYPVKHEESILYK
jgi:hypothetical protein